MIYSRGCLPKIPVNPYCVGGARRASKTTHKEMVTKGQNWQISHPGGNGCKIKEPYFTGKIHRISSPFFPVLCGLNRILLRIVKHSFNHGFFVYLS